VDEEVHLNAASNLFHRAEASDVGETHGNAGLTAFLQGTKKASRDHPSSHPSRSTVLIELSRGGESFDNLQPSAPQELDVYHPQQSAL
jgi:hypothetical protein